jgi:hypothetical protein
MVTNKKAAQGHTLGKGMYKAKYYQEVYRMDWFIMMDSLLALLKINSTTKRSITPTSMSYLKYIMNILVNPYNEIYLYIIIIKIYAHYFV